MFSKKIGIDLGTTNVLVYVPKKGIVINEPSVVAISEEENRVMAVGNEAKEMYGKNPESITVYRPLKDGVIADYRITQAMIRYFINKVSGGIQLSKPEVMVCIPAGVTSTERRAVIDATIAAGAKQAYLILEPLAAAIGAGIPIATPAGNMVVDIGGGTTEVAVISLGGIVAVNSTRVGGNKFEEAIINFIRKKHNLIIGEITAEQIKIKVGTAIQIDDEKMLEVRGRDTVTGLPRNITIYSNEIASALQPELLQVIAAVKNVLEQTPPELASDVIDRGMVLTGGGAMLPGLDKLIAEATGVPVHVVDDPLLCVAKGIGTALENLEDYKKSIHFRSK